MLSPVPGAMAMPLRRIADHLVGGSHARELKIMTEGALHEIVAVAVGRCVEVAGAGCISAVGRWRKTAISICQLNQSLGGRLLRSLRRSPALPEPAT